MTTALDHIDGLRDVFTDITQDCLMLDLTPCMVKVDKLPGIGGYGAQVQFMGTDVQAVITLADSWGLTAKARVIGSGTYVREGRFDLDGRAVQVMVFTGAPKLPTYPPGYAPVPCVVIEVDDDSEDNRPDRCPSCLGAGDVGQLPNGLIIECPRGCMTGAGQ